MTQYVYKDLDKFDGEFRPDITGSVWGHGEYGYGVSIFSSHDKEECNKALKAIKTVLDSYNSNKVARKV